MHGSWGIIKNRQGLSLVEFLGGAGLLLIALVTLMSLCVQEQTLNEHSSNMSWATLDADRVMEQLREQNRPGCIATSANSPAGFASWDDWLAADIAAGGGGGKSIQPVNQSNETVIVSQLSPGAEPLPVTVAVCWRHRGRAIGDCLSNPATSPATLVTLLTCH